MLKQTRTAPSGGMVPGYTGYQSAHKRETMEAAAVATQSLKHQEDS